MSIVLWALQLFLAVAFLAHGWLYLFPPPEMVAALDALIPPALRLFIGAAEILAALGLTLPGITRILPWLVPCAAAGLMIVTLSAAVLHASRGEYSSAVTTGVLFVLASFVAYMRWKVRPIPPRTVASA